MEDKIIKVYLVKQRDTSLANEDEGFVGKVFTELCAIEGIVAVDNIEEADFALINEKFSDKNFRYINQLLTDPFTKKWHHKFITINWDENPNGVLRGGYMALSKSRCYPTRHISLPYLKYPNPRVLGKQDEIENPQYLASFRGNLETNPLRQQLFDYYKGHQKLLVQSTESWFDHSEDEQQAYVDLILNSKFVICPPGYSATTYRVQEAMALGRCPVILSDEYPEMSSWDPLSCAIQVAEKDFAKLPQILAEKESHWKEVGLRCRQEWEKIAPESGPQVVAQAIADFVKGCDKLTQEEQVRFWKSRGYRKRQGWLLHQMILRKISKLFAIK